MGVCENDIRLDKTKFHMIGAILFTVQSALLHPTAVVKTRMQVAAGSRGMSVFSHILRSDGIPGIFRGFGTSAVGSVPGRILALTSLEVSKDIILKHTQGTHIPEASRVGLANGVAGMVSNLVSCVYFVPLDVVLHYTLLFSFSFDWVLVKLVYVSWVVGVHQNKLEYRGDDVKCHTG